MDPEKPTVAEEVRLKRLLQFSNLLAGGAASTAARSSASSSSSTRATVGPSAAAGSAAPTVHGGYTLGASSSVGSSSAPPVAPFAGGSTLGASSSAGLSLAPPVPTSSGGYTLGTLSAGPSSAPPVPTSSRGYTPGASVSSSAPRDVLSSGSASVINPRSSCPVEGSSGAAVMFLNGSDSADLSKILQRLLQSAAAIRPGLDACSTQQLPRRQPLQELNPGNMVALYAIT
ncbi:uncharacterized protein LOC127751414 [Frankliniella occidentalis]|uniref:Uncharacterized protein LOC127751414 n=1 Tax=Frankliniella occidentalis TaxID=133901 RepID=A0A9C6X828_FRAOC|nr:uncharacterized protein LOC127751414 [Frankliniella occidentalis]